MAKKKVLNSRNLYLSRVFLSFLSLFWNGKARPQFLIHKNQVSQLYYVLQDNWPSQIEKEGGAPHYYPLIRKWFTLFYVSKRVIKNVYIINYVKSLLSLSLNFICINKFTKWDIFVQSKPKSTKTKTIKRFIKKQLSISQYWSMHRHRHHTRIQLVRNVFRNTICNRFLQHLHPLKNQ